MFNKITGEKGRENQEEAMFEEKIGENVLDLMKGMDSHIWKFKKNLIGWRGVRYISVKLPNTIDEEIILKAVKYLEV